MIGYDRIGQSFFVGLDVGYCMGIGQDFFVYCYDNSIVVDVDLWDIQSLKFELLIKF